jgi:arylformamidase
MKILDITRPLHAGLAPWPGDATFDYRLVSRLADGASVNLGRVTTSVHSGTHADAFFHFDDHGLTMEQLALERYLGPAAVVDLTAKFAGSLGEITIADLEKGALSPRLLIKTGAWANSAKFPEAIPVLARGVAEWMQSRGVKLLGLDLPSVDAVDSKDLPNHHALQAADIAILEGLDLSGVAAGAYSLAALPLKIVGGDGAPVRAVLWRDE